MSNISQLDQTTIENPYDTNLERSGSVVGGGTSTSIGSESFDSEKSQDINMSGSTGEVIQVVQEQIVSGSRLQNLWISSWIKSTNYKPKTYGFLIDGVNGYIEANRLFIGSGGIEGGSLHIPDRTTTNSFHVDSNGDIWSGANYVSGLASAPFSVTSAGAITAESGTIGGCVLGVNSISSTVFVSGPLGSGWKIEDDGEAEFQNVTIRGKITSSVFEKGTISAVNGNVLISPADVIATDMTALDSSTITISGDTTFSVDEVLRIKDGTDDEWMLVTNAGSAPTYTVTRDLAGDYASNTNPIWTKGTAVVSMGVGSGTKTGFILMDSTSANSPYIDVYGRNSTTYSDYTNRVRIGWLKGITDTDLGLSSTDVWGIYADNAYIKGTVYATAGYFGGTTNGITVESQGLTITGSGFIRTATSGSRVEILHEGGDLSDQNGIFIYNSSGNKIIEMSEDGSSASVEFSSITHDTALSVGTVDASGLTTVGSVVNFFGDGTNDVLRLGSSGSATRTNSSVLKVNNESDEGAGITIASDSSGAYLRFQTTESEVADIIKIDEVSTVDSSHKSIINTLGYVNFPAYYHCSDFDDRPAALASTVISNEYWDGSGTNGTQTVSALGATKDRNTHLALETTATSTSSSIIQSTRYLDMSDNTEVEFRVKINSVANITLLFGLYQSSSIYTGFYTNSDNDANIYAVTRNGGSLTTTDTTFDTDISNWYTFRVKYDDNNEQALMFVNGTLVATMAYNPTSNVMKAYFEITNISSSDNKIAYIDYIKIWHGRDDTSAAT